MDRAERQGAQPALCVAANTHKLRTGGGQGNFNYSATVQQSVLTIFLVSSEVGKSVTGRKGTRKNKN